MKKLMILLPVLIVSLSLGGCNLQKQTQPVQQEIQQETPEENLTLIGIIYDGKVNIYDTNTRELINTIDDDRFLSSNNEKSTIVSNLLKFNKDNFAYYITKDYDLLKVNSNGEITIKENLKSIYAQEIDTRSEFDYNRSKFYIDSDNGTIASYYYNGMKGIGESLLYDIDTNTTNSIKDEENREIRSICYLDNMLFTCTIGYNEIEGAHLWNRTNTVYNFNTNTISRTEYIKDNKIIFDSENKQITEILGTQINITDIKSLMAMGLYKNKNNFYITYTKTKDTLDDLYTEQYINDKKLPENQRFIGWINDNLGLLSSGDTVIWYDVK